MAEITPPTTPFPTPTGEAIIGYTDNTYQRIISIRRSAILGLVFRDHSRSIGLDPETNQPIYVQAYGVAAVTAGPGVEVLVADFDNQAERRAWIRDNSAAWYAPAPAA